MVAVFRIAYNKLIIDYSFAIYWENWDGKEAFVDAEIRNGEEVRVSFEPDFWAELEFPV